MKEESHIHLGCIKVHSSMLCPAGRASGTDPVSIGAWNSGHRRHPGHHRLIHPGCLQGLQGRKKLLMRHEQLRKDATKKREEERRREAEQQLSLAEGDHKQLVSLAAARVENCHWMKRSRVLKIQWW